MESDDSYQGSTRSDLALCSLRLISQNFGLRHRVHTVNLLYFLFYYTAYYTASYKPYAVVLYMVHNIMVYIYGAIYSTYGKT